MEYLVEIWDSPGRGAALASIETDSLDDARAYAREQIGEDAECGPCDDEWPDQGLIGVETWFAADGGDMPPMAVICRQRSL